MKNVAFFLYLLVALLLLNSCKNDLKHPTKSIHIHPISAIADTNVVLPPAWAFGYVYGAYTNQEQSLELIDEIIAHDYPIDAFWIDSWIWDWQNQGKGPKKYLDFVADTISYPDMEAMWSYMEERNIKSGMWVWDCILQTGNEAIYDDFKSKGYFKSEYINTNSWHNGSRTTIMDDQSQQIDGTWCGNIDFENPEAVAYFKKRMSPFFEKGLDFLKLDRTDAVPVVKAMFELSQEYGKESKGRGFVFSHSNGVKDPVYKKYPGKWTDDTRSDWSAFTHTRTFQPWIPQVGLKENIAMYTDLDRHYHQIPFLANDMGGFAVSEDGYVDEELYIRWLQFATFVPLTTPFSQPENKSGNIAFNISKRADTIFKKYAHLKMKLFPYIYSYAHLSRIDGVNTIRPIKGDLYTYFFGDEFLVAPVYTPEGTSRDIAFPEGADYVNFWNNEVYQGGTSHGVNVSIDEIPLFVKKGAIVPMRKYSRSIEAGTNDFLELHIFPGKDASFQLIEDDEVSNNYLNGIFTITEIKMDSNADGSFTLTIHPAKGWFEGMPQERQWQLIIHSTETYQSASINSKMDKLTKDSHGFFSYTFTANTSEKIEVIVQ